MHSLNATNRKTLAERAAGFACLVMTLMGLAAGAKVQAQVTSVPTVVFSSSTLLGASNSRGATVTPDSLAHIGKTAANQRGDVFAIFADSSRSGYNSLIEVPAGTNTQVLLAKNVAPGVPATGVTVDSHGNVWFLTVAPDGYDSGVDIIPFVNGGYQSGIDLGSTTLPTCSLPIYPLTVPCQYPNIVAADFYGYLQLSDVAVDSVGNLYVADWADSIHGYDSMVEIVKYDATTGADTIRVDALPAPANDKTNGRLAVAPNGDIYYVDQAALYYSKAGSSTFSIIPGFSTPTGVSVDNGSNVYVTDSGNNRIAVLPNLNGSVSASSTYTLLNGSILSAVPYYSAGVDGHGTITYAGSANANSYYRASVGGLNFGSISVGTPSAATGLDLYFTSAETFGSVTLTGGSAFALTTNGCAAGTSYVAGATCSLSITYTPSAAGPQSGAVQVYSQAGTLLGTASLSGTGISPLLNVDPGTAAAIGSGWKAPSSVVVDGAGNTYVADATTGGIYKNGNGTAIVTGFSSPSAVTVDGAGNLYVADTGNNRIMEVPYSGTTYGTPIVIQTGLSGPSGLTLDAAGNLYIADSGGARVLLLSSVGGLPIGALVTTIGNGYTKPVAVATDNAGYVYISDSGSGQVLQFNSNNGATTTIASGLKAAAGLAIDGGGNLFYADSGAGSIVRVPNVAGALDPGGAVILTTPVVTPSAIAVDQAGNVYAADSVDATVAELSRGSGLLDFGSVVTSKPSQLLSAVVSNGGNAPLVFGTPYDTASGNAADFAVQSNSTCTDGGTVPTGGSCGISVVFTPSTESEETSTLTFASNAAAGSLVLQGVGTANVDVTITGATTLVYGNSATYAVTASQDGTYKVNIGGSSTATTSVVVTNGVGSFTIPVVGVGNYTIGLAGTTGTAALSVTPAALTVTAGNATRAYQSSNPAFTVTFAGAVNGDSFVGKATTTATAESDAGTYAIVPTAVGSAIGNYTVTTVNGVLTVTPVSSNTSVGYSSSNNGFLGGNVTFTATITSLTPGTPTGTVTFEDVTNTTAIKVLGTGTVGADGKAKFSTSSLIAGTIFVVAVYSGDVDFSTSKSNPTAVAISLPTFTLTASPQVLNIVQGQSGKTVVSVLPQGNFTSKVVFSCSGLPLEASCSFAEVPLTDPAVTKDAVAASSITITTVGPSSSAAMLRHTAPWKAVGGTTVLALLVGSFAGFRKKRFAKGIGLFVFISLLCLLPTTGCGLNGANFVTPLGISNVTITGASAATNSLVNTSLRLAVYTTSTSAAK